MNKVIGFGKRTKNIVIYGYEITDIVLFASRLLASCGKKVIVCDVTEDTCIYNCFKEFELEMKPVNISGVRYVNGYMEGDCDVRIVCPGLTGLWEFENQESYLVTTYSNKKILECKRFASNISEFNLIIRGDKPRTGPEVNILSLIDTSMGLGIKDVFEIGNESGNEDCRIKAEFYGIMDYEQLSKSYKELLFNILESCGIDSFTATREMK